jgi:hypothetical protein
MKRIHAFGCSLTAQHHWTHIENAHIPEEDWRNNIVSWTEGNFDVSSYAISGSSNNMQVIAYGNAVHKEELLPDDIVLWQLTCPDRYGIRNPEDIDKARKRGDYVLIADNIYSEMKVNMISHNVLTTLDIPLKDNQARFVGHALYSETETYSILWGLNGIKRRNNKTLVMFGWDSFNRKDEVVKFLDDNGIDYIEESILDYTIRKGIPQKDTMHPSKEGYKDFTHKKLLPKLRKLGWI